MRGVPRLRNTAPRRHRALSAYLLRFCPYPRMTRCNNLLPGTARSPAHDSPGHQDTLMVLAEYGMPGVRLTGRTDDDGILVGDERAAERVRLRKIMK